MKNLINYIEAVEKFEFKDWSEEKIKGYKEACAGIKEYALRDIEITNMQKKAEYSSMKELLLKWAKESGKNKFLLIASTNNRNSIFKWHDEEFNFVGMLGYENKDCSYFIDELPRVIDNAESWLHGSQEVNNRIDESSVIHLLPIDL